MYMAIVMKPEPVSGLSNVIEIQIGSDHCYIRTLIRSRGMPARSAADV
jgi:hypothetical protein